MGEALDHQIKLSVYMVIASVTGAIPLALVLGYGWVGFGKLWVIISMNVFGLPLLLTDLFIFPTWVWYIIVFEWVGKLYLAVRYHEPDAPPE